MRKPLFAGTDQLQVSANCFSSRLFRLAGAQLLLAMPSAPPVAAFVLKNLTSLFYLTTVRKKVRLRRGFKAMRRANFSNGNSSLLMNTQYLSL
jgi:hypothetical protein